MEQNSSQNTLLGLSRAPVNPGSLPPEYWSSLDSLYMDPDPTQHAHPPQQQQQQSQQTQAPLGIGWDHPVFRQHHPQQQQQQRSPLPTFQDPGHGLYSSTPQSWRPNPLHQQQLMPSAPQTPQGFALPSQYTQGPLAFDARSVSRAENQPYQQLPSSRHFYPQHLSVPEGFAQPHTPQPSQSQPAHSVAYQGAHQAAVPQYAIPAGFPEETPHTSMNFSNDFPETGISNHPTINPQFLDTPQPPANQPLNHFLYANPPGYARSNDPKHFDYFRNDLQFINPAAVNNQAVQRNQIHGAVFPHGQPALAPAPPKGAQPQQKPAVKKAPQPKAKKTATKTLSKRQDSGSSSESDSDDSLVVENPPEPSPIPPARPSDREGSVQYDTLRAVWFPRNRRPNADKIKNALVAFKDVVKNVRDALKEVTAALKVAENKGENDKADQLRKDAGLQRRLMDVVVTNTLEKGHPWIIEKLGEHPMAVAALYSFLLDRHQASDVDGTLSVNILKLLSNFVTVDEETLQKTNVAKLLPRFVKKGSQVTKDLAQKILDNAAASTKRKQENGKSSSKEGPSHKNPAPSSTGDTRNEVAGSKRPREGESTTQQPSKRMVVPSHPKGDPKGASKPANAPANGTTKRPEAPRPRANIVAPKPTNLFGSLSSASKRPGTSNAERAAAAAAKPAKTSDSAPNKENQPAPARPAFSFGDIMADLNKQKEPAPAEPAKDLPPETEEERKKRLRKEERRKLRVTWKPESSLTEVRLFTHDPEEELGPGDRSREVGDVKGEGSILKLHRDIDELGEEDDGGLREERLADYYEPSEVDFVEVSAEDRPRNFIKRGGTQEPDSAEKKAQDHREATTLMVFYTSPAEVPPSPKEPPYSEEEPAGEELVFGDVPDHVKARQERYYNMINPRPAAQQNQQSTPIDIPNLLRMLNGNQQQQQPTPPPPPPQPAPQAPMSDLERAVSMLSQPQQPPQQAQAQPQMPQTQATPDFQAILSFMAAQQQLAQPQAMPQPSQPAVAPNLAAIVSQFANGGQPNGSNAHEDPERKRMREGGYEASEDERHFKRRMNAPEKSHPKAGLVPCRYWALGKCRKGDDCTYRHDALH